MIAGQRFGVRYRTVDEHDIIELLLLAGLLFEPDAAWARCVAKQALDGWVLQGLGTEVGSQGARRFDPVEVFAFFKRAGFERCDAFWSSHFIATARQLAGTLPRPSGQAYEITLRRTFYVPVTSSGKSLRLRAPLPLSSVHGQLQRLDTFIEGATASQLRVSDGRLEARCVAEGQLSITLGATFAGSPAYGDIRPIESHSPQAYLNPVEDMIVISPRVRQLAEKLTESHGSHETAVRNFWNYMLDEFACGPVHYDQVDSALPCDWVLDSGYYDCRLGSALFIALCRSHGIPARLVSGHFLYARAPTNHSWAEVWFADRGWVPFDLLTWDLSRGGRDADWRDYFYGRAEHRLVMQRLPYEFTGAIGVMLPSTWHMLQRPCDRSVEISFEGLDRQPIYRDNISVSTTNAG